MERSSTPVGQQWRLRAHLRRMRTDRGQSLGTVTATLGWSGAKLSRIETGEVRISVSDLRALLHHYGVTDPDTVADLLDMARDSRQAAWWDAYRPHLTPGFARFIGLEAAATRIQHFQLLVVPGLLQVPEYTRALVTRPGVPAEQVERDVTIRGRRQHRLLAGDVEFDVEFDVVLDEATLHRAVVTGPAWRDQLQHLLRVADLPTVSLRLLPFAAGVLPGMATSFLLLDLAPDEPAGAVLLEHPEQDTLIIGDETRAKPYVESFHELTSAALTPAATLDHVRSLLR